MPVAAWQWTGLALIAIALLWLIWAACGRGSKGRRRCPRCWYDLEAAGDPPLTCSECGHAISTLKQLYRRRRRTGHALVALLLGLVGYASIATPRVQATGWRGAVPTTALVMTAHWLPRSWHDEEFYITGQSGPEQDHLQAMLDELNAERARIRQGAPETLAEELEARWANEPAVAQRLACHVWEAQGSLLGLSWRWMHGASERIELSRVPYTLREGSYRAGHLGDAQGNAVRRSELARVAPRMQYLGAIDRIGIEASLRATRLATPDVAGVRAHLVEGGLPESTDTDDAVMLGIGPSRGSQPIGPINLDAARPVIEYTFRDDSDIVMHRHVVVYRTEFFDAGPQHEQAVESRRATWVAGNIWPVEVDGKPVRVATRARRGAPIVYTER